MSGENAVAEGQVAPTETDDADTQDADFDAGFTGAPTETPGNQTEAAEDKQLSDAAAGIEEQPTVETPPAAPETPATPEYAQITKEQFDKLMAKADEVDNLKTQLPQQVDKAFGKIGSIERILQDLKATPAGQPLQLSDDDFAELKAEYPELAALQLKGMQRLIEKLPARSGGVDSAAIDKIVNERTATVRTEVIDSHLDAVIDGDWRKEVQTPQYAEWIAKQPADVKALEESSSLRDAARLMRLYKADRDAPPPPPPPPPPPASTTRTRVIAAAVPPKSAGAAPVKSNDDDDFEAGFKQG